MFRKFFPNPIGVPYMSFKYYWLGLEKLSGVIHLWVKKLKFWWARTWGKAVSTPQPHVIIQWLILFRFLQFVNICRESYDFLTALEREAGYCQPYTIQRHRGYRRTEAWPPPEGGLKAHRTIHNNWSSPNRVHDFGFGYSASTVVNFGIEYQLTYFKTQSVA